MLPHADETIVGEQGISLSGGQRARVNLARAIYKQADVYLLDDPLSAVDTHVGNFIFENCIKAFLQEKVCVLVTHQLQYLKEVKHALLMNNGRVEVQGTFRELKNTKSFTLLANAIEVADQHPVEEVFMSYDGRMGISYNFRSLFPFRRSTDRNPSLSRSRKNLKLSAPWAVGRTCHT